HLAIVELGEENYPAWEQTLHSIETGRPAFDEVFGMPVWEFYAQNPENARAFNKAMFNTTAALLAAIVDAYDFSPFREIVDVGGGHGGLLAGILRASPRSRGILFDRLAVVAGARKYLEAAGIADRCEIVPGDFFESAPCGKDAYLLKWVLHEW